MNGKNENQFHREKKLSFMHKKMKDIFENVIGKFRLKSWNMMITKRWSKV